MIQILGTITAFCYLVFCMIKKHAYATWPLNVLKVNLMYFYWIGYNPILECLVTVNLCDSNGRNIIDDTLICYSGFHIALMIISILLLLCAIAIAVLVSVLYQRTHPTADDALAQYLPYA